MQHVAEKPPAPLAYGGRGLVSFRKGEFHSLGLDFMLFQRLRRVHRCAVLALGVRRPLGTRFADFPAPCVRAWAKSSRALFLPFAETHKCAFTSREVRIKKGLSRRVADFPRVDRVPRLGGFVALPLRIGSGASQACMRGTTFPCLRFSRGRARISSRRRRCFRRARAHVAAGGVSFWAAGRKGIPSGF